MSQTGFLDSIEGPLLRGWAFDDSAKGPTLVDITFSGEHISTVACDEFRPDLANAGIGNGHHGFSFRLPPEYAGRPGVVSVRFASGGPLLNNGERFIPDLAYRLLLSAVLAAGLWCVDNLTLTDSDVTLDGWYIPPRALPLPIAFTHNGSALQFTRFRRDDLAAMLGLSRDEAGLGFHAQGPVSKAVRSHEFRFEHAGTKCPFDPNQTIHYLLSDQPLPPEHLRMRVHGAEDAGSFMREGSTTFVRIERVLRYYFSRALEEFAHILDWGCGSARVLRYVSASIKVTGIDIDPDAIAWCRQSFPHWQFHAVPTTPPTSLPRETFDLIYGISILTHLAEPDHLQWLAELHRLAKPGAIVLLTIFGDIGFWRSRLPMSALAACSTGFWDIGRSGDLDALGINREYYRNVYITRDYIVRTWSKYFDIVDIIPGGIGNLQDLAILRRR